MFDKAEFNACLARADMTRKDLALAINMGESTLYKKIRANGAFSRAEIAAIASAVPMDIEQVFFAQKVAQMKQNETKEGD